MKINLNNSVSNTKDEDDLRRFTAIFQDQVSSLLNGNLTFSDNSAAKLLTFVFTAANQTLGMDHNLGVIPSGYILAGSNTAVSLFDGDKANTIQTLYLRANGAATAKVLVFA